MNILTEIRVLRDEGKIHQRLITRTRVLLILSLALFSVVLFNVISRGADWRPALGLAAAGFALGVFLFSRMSPVQWNEEKEVVETGRMDTLGYIILALYIVLEIGLRTFLIDFFPLDATTFVLAGVFGVLFGRVIGTLIEVHRVYRVAHTG